MIKNLRQRYVRTLNHIRNFEVTYRSSHQRYSVKKVFLEISKNSQENTCARVSFLIKLQPETCNFIKKETLAQVFSCKFWEISKNTFFAEHLRATASAHNYHDTWQNINMSAKEIQFFPN